MYSLVDGQVVRSRSVVAPHNDIAHNRNRRARGSVLCVRVNVVTSGRRMTSSILTIFLYHISILSPRLYIHINIYTVRRTKRDRQQHVLEKSLEGACEGEGLANMLLHDTRARISTEEQARIVYCYIHLAHFSFGGTMAAAAVVEANRRGAFKVTRKLLKSL